MSWSILLLPLLGGYFFLTKSIKWIHFYKRTERQRLIFDSLLVGLIFFFSAFIIWRFFQIIDPVKSWYFESLIGIKLPYVVPAFLSLIVAIIFTKASNLVKQRDANWYLADSIQKTGNTLQKDFLESYFLEKVVMITLKNGKVYVGVVSELHEPHPESSFVKIILIYSGYRNDKMDVELVKDYNRSFIENGDNQTNNNNQNEVVSVTILESDILSMTFYDQDVYDRLNETN